jgi:hypothetical protein
MRSARYDDFDPRLAAGAWDVAGRATRSPGPTIIWMPASTPWPKIRGRWRKGKPERKVCNARFMMLTSSWRSCTE